MTTTNKTLFKIRPQVTRVKAHETLQALSLILICAETAGMAVHDLDGNYRSPVVHNKIKQISENCKSIAGHVRKMPVLREVDMEATEDISGAVYETLSMFVNFSLEEVQGFNGVIRKMMDEAREREAANGAA